MKRQTKAVIPYALFIGCKTQTFVHLASYVMTDSQIKILWWCIFNNGKNKKVAWSPGGRGTPLYGLYRYVRSQRVWFFSRFGHKLGIDFSHFATILVILIGYRFLHFSLQFGFLLEEATSSSRPSSAIRALPSSASFNSCYAGQIKPATRRVINRVSSFWSGHK